MADDVSKKTIARGIAWVGLAASLVAVLDLVALALILRFWVSAKEFGDISVVVTSFAALQLLGELGLPAAVVQRDDASEDRLSTVFWLGIAAGIALYGVVWAAAPLIAHAYGEPVVGTLFRVYGLVLLVRPFYTTHQALLRRRLQFQELSALRMTANSLEFAAKLGSAIAGAGVWCFALGPFARELFYAIAIPVRARWRPRRVCRPRLARSDFGFGMRSTGGELLFHVYSNLDYQIVAATFGTAAVGIYRAAKELVLEPVRFVSNVVTVVAFPTFARLRGDRAAVIEQYVAFTRQNLVAVLGLLSVVVVAAEDVLAVMLGPQYTAAAHAARILAIVGVFRALSHLGPPLLDGLGRPDLSLRYHVTATVVLSALFVVFAAAGDSFDAVAVAWAVGYPIAFVVLSWMVFGQLRIGPIAYLRRVGRIAVWIAAAAAAGFAVHRALGGASTGVRLAGSAAAMIALGMWLLAAYEGFSPRAIIRSLRR